MVQRVMLPVNLVRLEVEWNEDGLNSPGIKAASQSMSTIQLHCKLTVYEYMGAD